MKKHCTIKDWRLHQLSPSIETIQRFRPDVLLDHAFVLTGTIIEDDLNRWPPGDHMRSSLLLSYDEERGIVETENSIYHLQGQEGGSLPDLGDAVLTLFY